jgi:hypothetical protein
VKLPPYLSLETLCLLLRRNLLLPEMLQFEAKIGGEERGEKKSASSTTQ